MKSITYTIAISLLFLTSCAKYSNADITGNWEAATVLEEGNPLDIDNSQVKFKFTENGFYEFQSTLDYQESGTYHIKNELLFTKDTLNSNAAEKAVRIEQLTTDSLFIQMKDSGKKRIIKLFRNE